MANAAAVQLQRNKGADQYDKEPVLAGEWNKKTPGIEILLTLK